MIGHEFDDAMRDSIEHCEGCGTGTVTATVELKEGSATLMFDLRRYPGDFDMSLYAHTPDRCRQLRALCDAGRPA